MTRQQSALLARAAQFTAAVPRPVARRQPLRLALEPRMMFDGAAIATAVAQLFPAAEPAPADSDASHAGDPAVTPPDAAPPAAAAAVVFIDSTLANRDALLAATPAGAQVVLLDPARDGVQQIAEALAGRSDIGAIHLISHGNAGALQLGSSVLDAQAIAQDAGGLLAEIGSHLADGADVLIYGCNFGAGAEGAAATEALSHALGADVAASDDLTGARALGGDWALERHAGAIQTPTIDAASWDGLLHAGLNQPPVAGVGLSAFVDAGSSVVVNTLVGDFDPNGDAIRITSASALHGSVTVNVNNALVYTPTPGYSGTDVITYTIADSHGTAALLPGLVAVTVNALPTLALPTLTLFQEDQPIVFASIFGTQITVGDIDGNIANVTLSVPVGTLTLASTSGVSLSQGSGTADTTVTLQGTIANVNAALNGLIYTPAADYNGPVMLTIGLTDTLLGLPITAVLPINIGAVADIVGDQVTTVAGQPASFNVLANDSFENSGRVVSGFTAPAHGSVAIDAQGNAVYTPTSGYIGSDSFTYTVTSNGTVETATVTVTVGTPPNQAPTAVADSATLAEDGSASGNLLANDSDPDGDALALDTTPVVAPAHGTLVLNANGSYVYTPAANFHGSDSFTYRVIDANGASATATVTLVITPVNDAPTSTAVPDHTDTVGASVSVDETAQFADVDGDVLTYSATGLPPGLVLDPATGVISGTLLLAGSYSVTLTATDSGGLSTQQSFLWSTSAAPNQAPGTVGSLPASGGDDGTPVTLATAGGFNDADNDVLTYSASGLPPGLTIDANTGVISGTLSGHASVGAAGGVYTVIVSANDGRGGSAQQAFSFTAVNPAPLAQSDAGTALEDNAISGNVLANDSDTDGDALTVDTTPVSAPAHGTLVLNADGSYVYTPAANFHGSDSFTYRATDADGGSTTATVTLTIAAVNDAPTSTPLADRSNSVGVAVTLSTAANFNDPDGDALTYSATGLPPGLTLDATTGIISGTLLTAGSFTVTLTATDSGGLSTQQGFLWVSAAPVNNAPNTVGSLPASQGDDGAPVTLATAGGFSDADNDVLSYSASGLPPGLTIDANTGVISGTLSGHASVGAPGGVYTVTVTASDGRGGLAQQGFTLTAVNPAPLLLDDAGAGLEDGSISGNVLANDSDADGDGLVVATTPVSAPAHGTLVLNADGSYVYTPDANYAGSDSFTYRVTDADGGSATATVTLTVAAVNDAPTSTALADRSNSVGVAVTVSLAANFNDVDGDPLLFNATGLPPGLVLDPATGVISGTLLLAGSYSVTLTATDSGGLSTQQSFLWSTSAAPNQAPGTVGSLPASGGDDGTPVTLATAGGFNDADNDVLTYSASGLPPGLTIDANTGVISGTLSGHASVGAAGGVYTVIVSANDGRGGSAQQAFSFTAVNPAPLAQSDAGTALEDNAISGNVLANDSDTDGDALTVDTTPVSAPAHGTLVLNADGSYVYTPAANFHGSDSFTYRATDADGGSTTATVTLTIAAVNDAPTSTPLADRSNSVGVAVTLSTAANFNDPDGDALTYSATGLPPGLTLDATTGIISGTLLTAGSFTVTLTATDSGGLSTQQGFLWVSAAPVNNAPNTVGSLPASQGDDGAPVTLATAGGFSDADNDVLSYSASGLPPGLTIDANTGVISGTLSGHASVGAPGGVYTVTVTASDGRGGLAQQGFTLTAVNPAPLLLDDAGAGLEDGSISGNVLANDSDADGDGLVVATTPVSAPAHGTLVLNADGSYVYTPDANYAGSDSFTYRVTDADGGSATATVTLTVAAVNDAPTSTALADRSNSVGVAVTVSLAANFNDVDGDPLLFNATGLPPGLVLDPATGVISGTLLLAGSYSVTLTATDSGGLSTQQSFLWNSAAPPNNGPNTVGTLAAGNGDDGAAVAIATAAAFQDADGDLLGFSASGLPPGLSIDAVTGLISGTLSGNASAAAAGGVYTVIVTASDGRGGSAQQGFSFTVANPAPLALADVGAGLEDGSISGNVLTNDADPDGDALVVATTPVSAPAHGTLVLNADGSFVYTPAANFTGSDSFTYRATDADGGTATATVTLTVAAVNDAPTSAALADRSNGVGAAVNVSTAAHFSDADGEPLLFSATGLPPGLTVDAPSGVISGTLLAAGSFSVTVTATDASGASTQQTFVWTAAVGANNGPDTVGNLPTGSGNDGTAVLINTAAAFSDADGDRLGFSASGLPPGLSIDPLTGVISGTLSGHASAGAAGGVYTVIVSADDSRGGSASQGFTFTAVNPAPAAVDDTAAGTEDGSISGNVLANDSDADGDALTVSTTPVVAPAHGTLVLNADGSYVYTPDANYAGSDSFTYRASDADGGSQTATVTLLVAAANDAPTSTPLADRGNAVGALVSLNAATHFSDVDGDALQFSATGLPPGLSLDPNSGVIAGTLLAAGSYTVTLTATDAAGMSTQQSFQWVGTAATNNGPNTVGSLGTASGDDGASVAIATAAGFADPDGDVLGFSASGLPPGLQIDAATGLISGTLAANASAGAPGGVYTIVVTASDGRGGAVSQGFSFSAANPAPVALADAGNGLEDGTISGNVLANDADPDGDAFGVATTPVTGPANGTLLLNADGSFAYTPNANYHGSDSFTYRVTDAGGASQTATVTLTVAAVDDAPTSTPLADRSNGVGNAVSVDTAGNFSDADGSALRFSATGLPPGLTLDPASGVISGTLLAAGNYSVTLTATDPTGAATRQSFAWLSTAAPNNGPNTVGTLAAGSAADGAAIAISSAAAFSDPDGDPLRFSASGLPPGLAIDAASGLISGTLAGNASAAAAGGVYTVVVSAEDGRGGVASLGFTFSAANPAPTLVDSAGSGVGSISGNVLQFAADPDGDALAVDTTPVAAPAHGSVVINADGSYVYTPTPGYIGNDAFSYRVTDADGGSASASVSLTVVAPPPSAVGSIAMSSGNDGAPVTIATAAAFQSAAGTPLVFAASGLPPGLSIGAGSGVISGTLASDASSAMAGGTYSVIVSAADAAGQTASQTFFFAAQNPAPTAAADAVAVGSDGNARGNVLASVSDPDGDRLVVDTTPVVPPANGTLVINPDGSYLYTPEAGFSGADSFTVRVSDADGQQVNAVVSLTVAPAPTAAATPAAPVPPSASPAAASPAAASPAAASAASDSPALQSPPTSQSAAPAAGVAAEVMPRVAEVSGPATLDEPQRQSSGSPLSDTVTQTQIDAGNAATDTVLIEAINGINRLDGMGDLSVDRPLIAAVNAMRNLGGNSELGAGSTPMAQVVGDLNGASRTPLQVDNLTAGPYGASAFGNRASPSIDAAAFDAPLPTPTPAPAVVAPAAAAAGEVALNRQAAQPITLTEQLQTASLRTSDELEALALALN